MGFEIAGIDSANFGYLNDFFDTGTTGDQVLVENPQKHSLPDVEVHSNEWYLEGLRIGYSEWQFEQPRDLEWTYSINSNLITLQANLNGSIFAGTPANPREIFRTRQHNLFYSASNDAGSGFVRADHLRASLFFIQFRKDAFLNLTYNANESLTRFADRILQNQAAALSHDNLILDTPMQNIIRSIVSCPYKEGLKRMYLHSKSMELLVLQAESSDLAMKPNKKSKYIKSQVDVECLHYAREYVQQNLHHPPGLSQLSKHLGINEYKLKRGFRELFGTTVFGFIADERLKVAEVEVKHGTRSLAAIADELGYSSPQHFSNAFRKKFGYSPASLRKSTGSR